MSSHDSHGHHHHAEDHGHGHEHDQGLAGFVRYLRYAPEMWRSDIDDGVIELVAPQPGETIVDIGAGWGAGVIPAVKTGATIKAVEPTPFMRRMLMARRLLNRGRDRIEVVDGAAERTGLAADSADAIFAVNTMHHWVDIDAGVREIARVLRPDGRVILVDEDFGDPEHPDFEKFGGDDAEHHGFTMVEADRMGERLRAEGLVDVDAANRKVAGRPSIVIIAKAPAR